MKTQIDIKSALLGIAAGVLAMLAIGSASSPSDTGRYQVAVGTASAAIVDTRTGQAWGYFPVTTQGYRNDGSFFDVKAQ